jgi:DNA-binding transcriptional LysR family regulator
MDWDDYRIFAAVVAQGSVRGAAQALGVNASTVTRRLDHLEAKLGVSLLIRSTSGLTITTEGVDVAQRVEAIDTLIHQMEIDVKGRDQRMSGRIRIALPDVLATHLLLPELTGFTDLYPDINLELLPGYQHIDLESAEVDIAIRATNDPPETMVGRRIGPIAVGAYALGTSEKAPIDSAEIKGVAWVDWADTSEVSARYAHLRDRYFPGVKVAIRCDQIEMQRAAILADIGIGILPCFVGDADRRLVRLKAMPVEVVSDLWILTHPASRSVRRIQVLLAFLRDTLAGQAEMLAVGLA